MGHVKVAARVEGAAADEEDDGSIRREAALQEHREQLERMLRACRLSTM